jgi:hypothetical protein
MIRLFLKNTLHTTVAEDAEDAEDTEEAENAEEAEGGPNL